MHLASRGQSRRPRGLPLQGLRSGHSRQARAGRCATARSPGRLENSSRICREEPEIRDKPVSAGSQGGLAAPTLEITNVGDFGEIPKLPQPNWPQYNNFRSADIGLPPGEYLDLLAEVLSACADSCDGDAYIAARVRNAGNVEAPAGISVTLRAGPGGPVLATLPTTLPIPPGSTGEVLVFTVPAMALKDIAPEIAVDDIGDGTGVIFECLEDNNVALGVPLVCDSMPG